MSRPNGRRAMTAEINKPENRGYADNGVMEFKEAVARFMKREFGVALNPATEINHDIGSKPAAELPAAPGEKRGNPAARAAA